MMNWTARTERGCFGVLGYEQVVKKKNVSCVGRKDESEGRSTVVPPSSSEIYVSFWRQAFHRRDQH